MARRRPAPRDTKERILDAALVEFGAKGFRSASIDDIASRAGVTKGAIYYYFVDKDDLARDLHALIWERLKAEAMEAFDVSGDTVRNLNRCFDSYLTALARLGDARFFLRDSYALPALEDAAREQREGAYTLIKALLDEGVARADIVELDTGAMARVLVGAYNEATMHILETGEARPTLEVIRRVVAAFARTDAARSAGAPTRQAVKARTA